MHNALQTEIETYLRSDRSNAEVNDGLWRKFNHCTDSIDFLKAHRDWVEKHSWGFGDRAFHYMWYLLLRDDVLNRPAPELLEIGVYKGQIISLWALISMHLNRPVTIRAVSPFQGNKPWFGKNRVLNRLAQLIDSRYRQDVSSVNLYDHIDYRDAVHRIFSEFGLSEATVSLLPGYSQDEHIQQRLAGKSFDVIYIDGGHRYEEVFQDLNYYSRLVRVDGYFVIDDASNHLPGSEFWKGIESVSRAVDDWGAPGFNNVLNVGHNRVFKRKA